MKSIFILAPVIVITGFYSLSGAAQEVNETGKLSSVITIEQAIIQTLRHNSDLQSFSRNIDLAEENIDLAKSNYRPDVSITGDVSHSRSDESIIPGQDRNITAKSAGLNIRQPLYRGGQTVAEIKEQRQLKKATQSEWDNLAQNMIIEVVETYMAAYRATEAVRVNQDNAKLLAEEFKATQARFEAGELTKTDTSQANARVAEAQALVAQSQSAYETATARLAELTGVASSVEPVYPDIGEEKLPPSLNDALAKGLDNSPAVIAAKQQVLAEFYNVEQQKGAFMPQLSAGATAGYEDNPSGFGQSQSRQSATVSLNATIPVYQSGVLRNRVKQAKILKDQAHDDLESAERAVARAIISAWEDYHTTSLQISARESQLEASTIAYEGVHLEEEVGARSVLDVLDANQDVLDARLALIEAKTDKVNAYYRLMGAIGLLKESFWDNS
tara:strand:+ start:708 stop:2039 length:1332 start_codon:yes stop_codon:yes gene_type:complete